MMYTLAIAPSIAATRMASDMHVPNVQRTQRCERNFHMNARLEMKRMVRRRRRNCEMRVARMPRKGETKKRGSGRRNATGSEKLTPNIWKCQHVGAAAWPVAAVAGVATGHGRTGTHSEAADNVDERLSYGEHETTHHAGDAQAVRWLAGELGSAVRVEQV
jgi:hypothetical protein